MKLKIKNTLLLYLFLAGFSFAQTEYPKTMRLPVMLYDHPTDHGLSVLDCAERPFHEFSACKGYLDTAATGMVQDQLDTAGRPVFKENVFFNTRVDRWFRPSTDTAYPVALVPDTLVFHYDTTADIEGIYVFEDNEYFPLDSLGLVAAGKEVHFETAFGTHNFGFTMHLQTKYAYYALGAEAVKFNFRGDDDTWLFFNGRLMLDIGGVHSQIEKEISLKEVADKLGVSEGDTITLDLFFAERNPTDSHIRITLNAPRSQPTPWLAAPIIQRKPGSHLVNIGKHADEAVYIQVNGGPFAPINDSVYIPIGFPTVLKAYGVKTGWQTKDTATLTLDVPVIYSRVSALNSLILTNEYGLDMFYIANGGAPQPYTAPVPLTGVTSMSVYSVLGDWKSQVQVGVERRDFGLSGGVFQYVDNGLVIFNTGAYNRAVITAPNGRKVRTITLAGRPVTWDLSDNRGIRLPYGFYFLSLMGKTATTRAKILVR